MSEAVGQNVDTAVLNTKLDYIVVLLEKQNSSNRKEHDQYEEKMDKIDKRVQGNTVSIAKIETKQTTLAYIQGAISVALSSAAAYFGMSK